MRNKYFRGFGLAVVGCAAILGLYLLALQLYGNFHTVIPGELYRSGQPTAQQVARYHDRYGIRTIVNLRGGSEGDPWYDEEVAEARSLGIAYEAFPMSSSRPFSADRAAELIRLLRGAEKPILIHCKAGADRSGLVSALYMAAVAGADPEEAGRQLSIAYGHVGVPYLSPTYAMDRSWETLKKIIVVGLPHQGAAHAPAKFKKPVPNFGSKPDPAGSRFDEKLLAPAGN